MCFNNHNELQNDLQDDHEILILSPDFIINNDLQEMIIVNNLNFELRMVSSTTNTATQWDGIVYSRHGGPNHQSWWYQKRRQNLSIQTPDGTLNGFDTSNTQVAVYVKTVSPDMDKLRHDYLVYMGGQKHIFCRKHDLPLIASSKRDNICTLTSLPSNTICGKKEIMCCSELNCHVRICKTCYDTHDVNVVTNLDQPNNPNIDADSDETNDVDEDNSSSISNDDDLSSDDDIEEDDISSELLSSQQDRDDEDDLEYDSNDNPDDDESINVDLDNYLITSDDPNLANESDDVSITLDC